MAVKGYTGRNRKEGNGEIIIYLLPQDLLATTYLCSAK